MNGRPVWLASLSMYDRGELIPAETWGERQIERGERLLRRVLRGVGDESRERLFRMCITMCYHRGLTDAEEASLSPEWQDAVPEHLAGGPLHVYWSKGIPDIPSTHPCESPGKEILGPGIYLPIDCGRCAPCLSRIAIQQEIRSSAAATVAAG